MVLPLDMREGSSSLWLHFAPYRKDPSQVSSQVPTQATAEAKPQLPPPEPSTAVVLPLHLLALPDAAQRRRDGAASPTWPCHPHASIPTVPVRAEQPWAEQGTRCFHLGGVKQIDEWLASL